MKQNQILLTCMLWATFSICANAANDALPPVIDVVIEVIHVNDDDDSAAGANEVIDFNEVDTDLGELSKVTITLKKLSNQESVDKYGSGKLKAVITGKDYVRIWKKADRSEMITLSGNTIFDKNVSIDMSQDYVEIFYVEGIKHSITKEDVIIEAGYTIDTAEVAKDTAKTGVWQVDLDVDSENKAIPWNKKDFTRGIDDAADAIEVSNKDSHPGKIYFTGTQPDVDGDGVPDWADGYGVAGGKLIDNGQFLPVIVELPEPYDMSLAKVQFGYELSSLLTAAPAEGAVWTMPSAGMRLWKKDANVERTSDDLIKPNAAGEISWVNLAGSSRKVTLYLEAVTNGDFYGKKELKITVTGDGPVSVEDKLVVNVAPIDLVAHKRGTIDLPGEQVAHWTGKYGYETIMLENADSDIEPNNAKAKADYEINENAAQANKDKDNDFIKVKIKCPKNLILKGTSIELIHEGVTIDGTKKNAKQAIITKGSSKLLIYDDQGKKLNPTKDLKIDNMEELVSNVYLSKMISNGEVTLYIQGSAMFGNLSKNNAHLMGGARLKLRMSNNNSSYDIGNLIIYRGGFFVYHQKANQPGEIGTLEFYDGKGRIHQKTGGKYNEFATDEWDMGVRLKEWKARCGKKTDGSQGGVKGHDYDVTTKQNGGKLPCGHLPPGWWHVGIYKEISEAQDNKPLDGGRISQGAYCRWLIDDNIPYPYANKYTYNPKTDEPNPISIKYKFDLLAIKGTDDWTRDGFQIHPDGKNDGTAGCIGIQTVTSCKEVLKMLEKFNGLKLRCIRE